MKKHLIGFLLGICLTMLLAFDVSNYTTKASTAEVNKVEGLYIFTDCQPVIPYDTLGVVESGFITGTQYEQIRNNLIKRAKIKHPSADALIMDLERKGVDSCIAIKIK